MTNSLSCIRGPNMDNFDDLSYDEIKRKVRKKLKPRTTKDIFEQRSRAKKMKIKKERWQKEYEKRNRHKIRRKKIIAKVMKKIAPKQPPGDWFDEKVEELKNQKNPPKNPEAVAGHIWYHVMHPKTKKRKVKEYEK